MKKTILILGGTGFLGGYLSNYFSKKHKVLVTSRNGLNADFPFSLNNDNLEDIIQLRNIDIIINCIVSYSPDFESCFQINAVGIVRILKSINRNNSHFINISSIFAYNLNRNMNAYSLTKSIGDDILYFYGKSIVKTYTILRFAQIFDKIGLAQNSQKGFYYLVNSVKQKKRINLLGRFFAKRSYIPVELVCEAVELAIDNDYYGIHNVIMADNYTNYELLKVFSSFTNYDLSLINHDKSKKLVEYHIPESSQDYRNWLDKKECTIYFKNLFNE